MDENDRKEYGLPPSKIMNPLKGNNEQYLKENYVSGSTSDWVDIETILSTSIDQTAIAPGTLVKQWSTDDRCTIIKRMITILRLC